ncbi:MAG: NfeD family protein [Thermoplasmata archaeon]
MEDPKTPGFFSLLRWSPGSIIIILILSILNVLLILSVFLFNLISLIYIFILGLAVELLIVFIKGFENIVIMENKDFNYENKLGIALTNISPGKEGVVRIKNELWSARSFDKIKKGDKIIVEKQEGIYLIVRKM